ARSARTRSKAPETTGRRAKLRSRELGDVACAERAIVADVRRDDDDLERLRGVTEHRVHAVASLGVGVREGLVEDDRERLASGLGQDEREREAHGDADLLASTHAQALELVGGVRAKARFERERVRLLVEGELDLGGLAEKDAKERSDRVSKRLEHAGRHVLATLPDRLAKEVERVRVELRAFDPLGELRLPRLEICDSLVKADRVLSLQPLAQRESLILELALPFLRR